MNPHLKVVILLLLINYVHAQEQCADEYFQCNETDLSKFYFGVEFECNAGTLCNREYIIPSGTTGCSPCLTSAQVCTFQCETATDFTIGNNADQTYSCPDPFVCNARMENNCNPCVREVCEEAMFWSCSETDPTAVITGNILGRCNDGFVCKNENIPPCGNPCIQETVTTTDPNITPTTTTETTPTTQTSQTTPTTPTTETTPTTPTTETTPTTPTTPSTETTPTTPTTPTTQTTPTPTQNPGTTAPPFKIPDCNDGQGATNRCRPGPSNRIYYYKCKYYSPVWYDYEIKLCKDLPFDTECIGRVC